MESESWFTGLRRNSWKSAPETDKEVVGVLAFEVASLMSKIIILWNNVREKEIIKKRREILSSVGVRKLVADDEYFLMDLVLNEVMHNFGVIATSVARLGRKCTDGPFRHFEHFVKDPVNNHAEWMGWEYRPKKMEKTIKKMERFVAVTMQLSQEMDVLEDLEQTRRRLQAHPRIYRVKLPKFQQKVTWQRHEVRNLREMSPWILTYDYIVRLLARSLLTILDRTKIIFRCNQLPSAERNNCHRQKMPDYLSRSRSVPAVMQSSIHPSEKILSVLPSGRLCGSGSKPWFAAEKNRTHNKQQLLLHPSSQQQKHSHLKTKVMAAPFMGCGMSGSDSPMLRGCKILAGGSRRFPANSLRILDKMDKLNKDSISNGIYAKLLLYHTKCGLLNAPSSSLGTAALAIHYANVILLLQELILYPHLIDFQTRDDLYDMLPETVRAALRVRLKVSAESLPQSVYDPSVAEKWSRVLARILKWLSPLAHSMIRWQAERNFEKGKEVSRTNVLLVQTLHYADQAKTEAAITELLVGLNYICRINMELNKKGLPEFSVCRANLGIR